MIGAYLTILRLLHTSLDVKHRILLTTLVDSHEYVYFVNMLTSKWNDKICFGASSEISYRLQWIQDGQLTTSREKGPATKCEPHVPSFDNTAPSYLSEQFERVQNQHHY